MSKENTKVITGPDTRFSYCCVWEPRSYGGRKPRYSIVLLIPKSDRDTVEKIREAIQNAYLDGAEILKNEDSTLPTLASMKTPMRDGDKERPDDPVYAGYWFLNASSLQAPEIVDERRNAITNRDAFYSGCYGRASISFRAYCNGDAKGITCGLNNLQKLRDGEALNSRTSAAEDFA